MIFFKSSIFFMSEKVASKVETGLVIFSGPIDVESDDRTDDGAILAGVTTGIGVWSIIGIAGATVATGAGGLTTGADGAVIALGATYRTCFGISVWGGNSGVETSLLISEFILFKSGLFLTTGGGIGFTCASIRCFKTSKSAPCPAGGGAETSASFFSKAVISLTACGAEGMSGLAITDVVGLNVGTEDKTGCGSGLSGFGTGGRVTETGLGTGIGAGCNASSFSITGT